MYHVDFSKPIHIHFIGIGGISMSGLAEILIHQGFQVSGSDMKSSALTKHLSDLGVSIFCPQQATNIPKDTDCVVYTAAISSDNPEFVAAKEQNIPMLSRAELLGQIMNNYQHSIAISGTHGKTTTTSIMSQILLQGEKNPTISVGGILPSIQSNVHVGDSDVFITEACEYTNSFLQFYPRYSVILNVEAEHLDFFKDLEDVRNSFRKFASHTQNSGALIVNGEIPNLWELTQGLDCKIVTFGLSKDYDYYATDITYNSLGCATFTPVCKGNIWEPVTLHIPGEHNITNALSCIALSNEMRLPKEQIYQGLTGFDGVNRRFQYKGNFQGATLIDDYAHHPTEISATMKAALNYQHKKLYVVFQPHTYTRTKAFLEDFAKALSPADHVILCDIYAAREKDIYHIHSKDLQEKLQQLGTTCSYFPTFEEIKEFLKKNCSQGDLLITMGAGDVVTIGEDLLK